MAAAWVALIDVDENAGPVFYYPKSHKLPKYNMQDFGLDKRQEGPMNYAKYQDIMEAYVSKKKLKQEKAIIKRGECLIWSANLIHGGPPATVEKLRRLSQVTHYFFQGADYMWVPVASNVDEDDIEYYDVEAIRDKWSQSASPDILFAKSKFKHGKCTDVPKSSSQNPCNEVSRIPRILSKLLKHDVKSGEAVM